MIAEGEYTQAGRTRRTVLYVFQKSGLILKYRLSHDKETPADLLGHFDNWLKTTAGGIRKYPS